MRPLNSCDRQLNSINRRKRYGYKINWEEEDKYAKQKIKFYANKLKKERNKNNGTSRNSTTRIF
jgi:hypothetical protein